ncbi:hypothetical protein BD410DRAFT_96601 [Rickenella mellea]|uniref:Uncharacterized protein n=1 Tax=Rickenella mellea TaxID=50990 RepID=A0A4Y7QB69_9AGAM|nr:hypothetical protein BD410DRAFT_96601 [Rickenella mellea]
MNGTPQRPESAVKAFLELNKRAERVERDAALRLQIIFSRWTELERYLGVIELRAADARKGFTRMAGSLASSPEPPARARPSPNRANRNLNLAPGGRPNNAFLSPVGGGGHPSAPPFQALPLPPSPPASSSVSASQHAAVAAASTKRSSHRLSRGCVDEWEIEQAKPDGMVRRERLRRYLSERSRARRTCPVLRLYAYFVPIRFPKINCAD